MSLDGERSFLSMMDDATHFLTANGFGHELVAKAVGKLY